MNENDKLHEQALRALISVNRSGVKALLRSYKYKISDFYSDNDLYAFLIVEMSKNSAFTGDVLALLQQASNHPFKYADDSSSNTGQIIAGALQGLGMITSTWMGVAKIKSDTSKYDTTYTVDGKKSNTLVIAGVVIAGIILIGIMAIIVINSTKKR